MEASRDHVHPELHLDYACMGREAEDRASPMLVGRFSKDRWLITHTCAVQRYSASLDHWKTCERRDHEWRAQTLMVRSDQEVSIVDVKNSLMKELRGVEGLIVMPEESALIERSVWEMQSTTRAIVAYAEWVHEIVFEPGSAILAWAVEFSGQVSASFKEAFRIGRQRMNAGCRRATAKRLFRSVNW